MTHIKKSFFTNSHYQKTSLEIVSGRSLANGLACQGLPGAYQGLARGLPGDLQGGCQDACQGLAMGLPDPCQGLARGLPGRLPGACQGLARTLKRAAQTLPDPCECCVFKGKTANRIFNMFQQKSWNFAPQVKPMSGETGPPNVSHIVSHPSI